jgi:hypothetical protein
MAVATGNSVPTHHDGSSNDTMHAFSSQDHPVATATTTLRSPYYRTLSERTDRPMNEVDYRLGSTGSDKDVSGPRLRYLWCNEDDPLSGQTLYLGGEVGSDGNIYYIPGHGTSQEHSLDPCTMIWLFEYCLTLTNSLLLYFLCPMLGRLHHVSNIAVT